LAKGECLVKDGAPIEKENEIDWQKYGLEKAVFDWELTDDDFQFSIPVGIKMVNDVITKPYAVEIDITAEELPEATPDAFLMMMDREGKWCVNTVIQGFTDRLGAICSSFTTTDDVIVIGKQKKDMKQAMERMKEIGGVIVIVHNGEILKELSLDLYGQMYQGTMSDLIEWEKSCIQLLKEAGYQFEDPVFNLLFLSSTHLPYIRISPMGIIDVLKREVIVPANMRYRGCRRVYETFICMEQCSSFGECCNNECLRTGRQFTSKYGRRRAIRTLYRGKNRGREQAAGCGSDDG